MSMIWVELADFLEEKLNKLIKELEVNYDLNQDEALLNVKQLVDSWARMRGLIEGKEARARSCSEILSKELEILHM